MQAILSSRPLAVKRYALLANSGDMAFTDPDKQNRRGVTAGIILAGLAMSAGWGFRGDYGH